MPLFSKSSQKPKSSLGNGLWQKYEGHAPLKDLKIPFKEAVVTLHVPPEFREPVFRLNEKKGLIEVFPGGPPHLRDYSEAQRDFIALRTSLDTQHAQAQAAAKSDIERLSKESAVLAQQLSDGYKSANVSALRLGKLGDDLSTCNTRLELAKNAVTKHKGAISGAMYLALSLNSPVKIDVGELARVVVRLRDRTLLEFGGALPRKSGCEFNRLVNLEVVWNARP